jgi:hypothetical protein
MSSCARRLGGKPGPKPKKKRKRRDSEQRAVARPPPPNVRCARAGDDDESESLSMSDDGSVAPKKRRGRPPGPKVARVAAPSVSRRAHRSACAEGAEGGPV